MPGSARFQRRGDPWRDVMLPGIFPGAKRHIGDNHAG
jgi:hypothetical protein